MKSANRLAFEALCALAGVEGLEDAAMLTDDDGNEGPNAEAMDVLRPLFAAAQAEARREALEEAAKLLEDHAFAFPEPGSMQTRAVLRINAHKIRAAKVAP